MLLSLSPHPGLPLVREDFFVDDRYVIAMDWIEGTDLEAVLDARGRPGLEPAARDRRTSSRPPRRSSTSTRTTRPSSTAT